MLEPLGVFPLKSQIRKTCTVWSDKNLYCRCKLFSFHLNYIMVTFHMSSCFNSVENQLVLAYLRSSCAVWISFLRTFCSSWPDFCHEFNWICWSLVLTQDNFWSCFHLWKPLQGVALRPQVWKRKVLQHAPLPAACSCCSFLDSRRIIPCKQKTHSGYCSSSVCSSAIPPLFSEVPVLKQSVF